MRKETDEKILTQIKVQADLRGMDSLSDEQLLALIIKEGDGIRDVLKLSSAVLERFSVRELASFPRSHILSKVGALTDDSLMTIRACKELYDRINGNFETKHQLSTADDVYTYMRNEMIHYKKEYFRAIAVNNKLEVLGTDDVSIGTIDSAGAHPREVFYNAISMGAYGIFLVHNHPSDNPAPSRNDIIATQKIRESGDIIGIKLIDHIIITSCGYYSFNTDSIINVPKEKEIDGMCSQNGNNMI